MPELEELSIALNTDACGLLLNLFPMLRQCPRDGLPVFNLRRLAFDCEIPKEPRVPLEKSALVTTPYASVAAVLRMLRLEIMELRGATASSATLFRFWTKGFESKITWRINCRRVKGDQVWEVELRKD